MTVVLDQWYQRCDFCTDATTDLKLYEPLERVTTVGIADVKAEVEDIGPWCACRACAELIDSNRWRELADRALVPLRELVPDVTDELHVEMIRSMWSKVFGERMTL